MKTYEIAKGAITIAVIFVCLMLFKGSANILNGIFVTLALCINMKIQTNKGSISTFIAFFLMCLLFFKQQIFFAIIYCLLAFALFFMLKKGVPWLIRIAVLFTISFVGFIFVIKLTDYFLMTHIESILLRVLKDNYAVYYAITAVEAFIVVISIDSITRIVDKRLRLGQTK